MPIFGITEQLVAFVLWDSYKRCVLVPTVFDNQFWTIISQLNKLPENPVNLLRYVTGSAGSYLSPILSHSVLSLGAEFGVESKAGLFFECL